MSFALLFPGQGSQTIGMLATHAQRHPQIRATFEEAGEVLSRDLFKLIQAGPEDELNSTLNTQPVMLSASIAVWRVWRTLCDQSPQFMSGHSLGEYSALTCAGVFEFSDAVKLVRKRAELMQAAVPPSQGLMAVVLGLNAEQVVALCADASTDTVVEAVNFNSATQIVVAGHCAAVDRLISFAKQAGARRCVTLPISVPAHSSLLKEAADEFAGFLATVPMQKPNVPVLHNTDAMVSGSVEDIRATLVVQMHTPVRWLEIIRRIGAEGVYHLIEMGPGRVLSGLNRQIDKTLNALSTDTPENMQTALASIAA